MIFMLLLLLLQLIYSQDEIMELEIEKVYEFMGIVPGSSTILQPVHYYKFTIENVIKDEDVFVVLKALHDESSFPSLYMSQVNQQPSVYDELCGNEGLDVCIIKEEDLVPNTTFYLAVFCMQDCSYQLTIHYEEEEILELGEAVIVTFYDEIEGVVKIGMPPTMSDIDRIIIRAHYLYDKNIILNETFHFYINEGNEIPSPSSYHYMAEEIWSIGKGVVIYKNATNLVGNLTILLLGAPHTRLYFLSIVHTKVRDIGLFERIDDLVSENRVNYYKVTVQNEYLSYLAYNSLSFDIHPFDGNPDVYIEPCSDCSSEDYTNYAWQSQLDQGYESMTISAKERAHHGNATKFMIAISGVEEFSSYSFVVYLSNYFSRLLTTYSYESGFLVLNESAEYIVDVYSQNDQTFTITATYPPGSAIIILKKCMKDKEAIRTLKNAYTYINSAGPDNFYNCSITDDQIKNLQIGTVMSSGNSELHVSDRVLQFHYNKSECESDAPTLEYENVATNCQYAFAIVSQVESMKYTLFIKGEEQHVRLMEGTVHRSFLMEYDSDLYQFTVDEDDLKEVVFQIAVINGEYEAFASRDYENPNQTYYDRFANMELDAIQYKEGNLCGTYYIRVIASTLTRYTITPIVYRKESDTITYIHLTEGLVHSHLQTTMDQVTYYNFETTSSGPVFIHLNGIYGYFIAHILDSNGVLGDKRPSDSSYQHTLRSSEHTIIIEDAKQYYYIAVSSLTLGRNESYEIQFTSSSSLSELFYGEPFYTSLDDTHVSYYYFQSIYDLEKLLIVRTYNTEADENNNLQIYVSTQWKYPNSNNSQLLLLNQNFIALNNLTLNTIVYIGVYSKGYNEFSLLIRGVAVITQLEDDIIQEVPMPAFEEYQSAHLYYQIPPHYNRSIQIQAYTEFAELELLCSIVDYASVVRKLKNDHSIFPTEKEYQIEEEISTSVSSKLLLITPNYTQNCSSYVQGCVILITVKLDQKSLYTYLFGESFNNVSSVGDAGQDGYFSIMVSSEYTTIRNGEVLIGYSGESIMSYYYFYVDTHVEFIQITVRPIDEGDPDIYVTKLVNGTITYPTIDQNDFRSISYKSDFLIINTPNNEGEYIIGITGFQEPCTYELSLNFADIQLSYIQEGKWVRSQHINQTVYFFYQHTKKESFRILFEGMLFIDVAINTHKFFGSDDGLYDAIPYYGTEQIQILKQHNNSLFGGIVQITTNDTHFCYYCTYIIAIKPILECDISILIAYNTIPLLIENGIIYYDQCVGQCSYMVSSGELHIAPYSLGLEVDLYKDSILVNKTNVTSNYHLPLGNDTYKVQITSTQLPVQYVISVLEQGNYVTLHLGKSYQGNQSQEFTFTPLTTEKWYTLIVNSQNSIKIDMYYLRKTEIEFKQLSPVHDQRISKSQYELKYQIPSVDYLYKLVLQSNGTYNIMISLEGLKYIDTNQHYLESTETEQSYEIYGVKGQELYIEKIDCLGNSTLNQSYFEFNNHSDLFFQVTPKDFATYQQQGLQQKKVVYSIVPHLHYSHDKWSFTDGNYSTDTKNNQVTVKVHTMKRNKTGVLNLKLLTYQLHYANSKDLMPAFGCQLDIEAVKHYTSDGQIYHSKQLQTVEENEETVQFQFFIPSGEKILYGLVVFQAFYEDCDVPYTFQYNVSLLYNQTQQSKQEIPKEPEQQQFNLYLILVISALGIICLMLAARYMILRCKQRNMKDKKVRVDEEQEQVRVDS